MKKPKLLFIISSILIIMTMPGILLSQENYSLSFDGEDDYVDCGIPNDNFTINSENITWYVSFKNRQSSDNNIIISQE